VASLVGMATILSWGNPAKVFADIKASLTNISALQPDTVQSTPTIQTTADAQASAPTPGGAPVRDEVAAVAEPANQAQMKNNEPSSGALLGQFQAWAAKQDMPTQVEPVRPVQDARAEIRSVQNPRPKVRREKNAQVPPVSGARAQDQSVQNAQPPSFLQRWADTIRSSGR
jgi:hypothetical protein